MRAAAGLIVALVAGALAPAGASAADLPQQTLSGATQVLTWKGASADLTLCRLVKGEFRFTDSHGQTEIGDTRLEPVMVVRGGRPYTCVPTWQQPPHAPHHHAHPH